MNTIVATAGNSGPKLRSDCEVSLELASGGGITVDLSSKVKTLYGKSDTELIKDILHHFGIADARVKVNDCGALPYVIAARTEAAIKKLVDTSLEYPVEMIPENRYHSSRHRVRFARLYLPGNNPSLMINAGLHSADGIILDLEDSVAPDRKDEARILVRNALRQVNFYGAERMIRINQGDRGIEDLKQLIPHNVHLVIVPKCENGDQVRLVSSTIAEIRNRHSIETEVLLMPVIETATGVENARDIASASPDIAAIAIGLEDYTSDLGVQRTMKGRESFYARTRLVVAAKASGIQAIDSVFSDIDDLESLKETVDESKKLGFEGMGCIHPRQIQVIRQGFAPDADEISRAIRIRIAFEKAMAEGQGVIALGSKMIDAPVAARAERTVILAERMGLLPADWRESFNPEQK